MDRASAASHTPTLIAHSERVKRAASRRNEKSPRPVQLARETSYCVKQHCHDPRCRFLGCYWRNGSFQNVPQAHQPGEALLTFVA